MSKERKPKIYVDGKLREDLVVDELGIFSKASLQGKSEQKNPVTNKNNLLDIDTAIETVTGHCFEMASQARLSLGFILYEGDTVQVQIILQKDPDKWVGDPDD